MKSLLQLLIGSSIGIITACGGGENSAPPSNSPPATSISYSGTTTQAEVTTANATALSADAYLNGMSGVTVPISGLAKTVTATVPVISQIACSVRDSIALKDQPRIEKTVGLNTSVTINGAVSGSVNITFNLNETNSTFSGSETFYNFRNRSSDPLLSGKTVVSGTYDPTTRICTPSSVALSSLRAVTALGVFNMYGTINFSADYTNMGVSCILQDPTGNTFWVKDWNYTLVNGNMSVTGRYYNPSYGYIDLTTVTPLSVASFSGQPFSGALKFTGANGTSALLLFSVAGHTVSVDTATGQNLSARMANN